MDNAKQEIYNFALSVLAMANQAGDDATSHAIEAALSSSPAAEVLTNLRQAWVDLLPRLRQRNYDYPADLGKKVEAAIRDIDRARRGKRFWFF